MTENLELWRSVARTDPAAVKPITGKSYRGNSPKPYWLIERATEVFGPVGIGWGCTVKSERFERISETDVLHVAVVSVWYVWNGKRTETFDQMGGTKAAYRTSSGSLLVDEDAGKKSVTDGMVKCLSMIGFAGDIFSGRWDDSAYAQEVRQEFAEQKREENAGSVDTYVTTAKKLIGVMSVAQDLRDWWDKEKPMREALGLAPGTPAYKDLYEAWMKRGRLVAASSGDERRPKQQIAAE